MQAAQVIRRFCAEAALWFLIPAIFLAVYTSRYPVSTDAVGPHLYLLTLVFAAVALARAALARLIPWRAGSRLASALVVSGALAAMLVYYALVIVGLESWGRVISWDLMTTYALQIPQLADALGVSVLLVAAAVGLCFLALYGVVWAHLGRFDWIAPAARSLSGPLFGLLMVCGVSALAIESHRFVLAPWAHQTEPVSLTFFPEQSTRGFQNHGIDNVRAQTLARREDAARSAYQPNPAARRRNLILIVVDGLRADHMGVYGYARDTTPNLARLARAGVLRRADPVYAACGESVCGLVSLASSRYMHEFSTRTFTLHEVLKRHGYRVHMLLGGDHKNFYGLSHFYGEVDSYYDGSSARGRYMNDDLLVLDRIAEFPAWDGVPVMLQVHLMSAHVLGKRHDSALRHVPAANYMVPGNRGAAGLDEARTGGRAVNYYDNGVIQADAVIGDLLQALESKGYLRDALVVVTADHGESLGEGGRFGHANSVAEAVLRVPLLLISYGHEPGPPIGGRRLGSHVDVAPTILAELGMPPPATWSGVPLQASAPRDIVYFQQKSEAGLIDGRDGGRLWKYWIDVNNGRERAFELGTDPAETRDRIGEVPLERRREWRLRVLPGAAQSAVPAGA